jgi:energy-coupling factor transporter ATP-binding protein EcfA2
MDPRWGQALAAGALQAPLQDRLRLPVRRPLRLPHDRRECRDGPAEAGAADRGEITERVHEALELVDLDDDVGTRLPAELSGGMRKRVGIARAIALRPKYLLYDEPTTGLDPVTSAIIDQLMVRMQEQLGVTGIVITHDMRSAYTVGTRIAMLYEGKVRQVGTVDEIKQSTDPIVRQFIEGRAELEPVEPHAGHRAARPVSRRKKPREEVSAGGIVFRHGGERTLYLLIRDPYRNWGFPKGHLEDRARTRRRRPPRGGRRDGARRPRAARRRSRRSTGLPLPRAPIHKVCHFFLMETGQRNAPRPQRAEGITACRWASYEQALHDDLVRQRARGARAGARAPAGHRSPRARSRRGCRRAG